LYSRNVSGQHVKGEASISKAMVDALTERLHSDAKQTKKVRIVGLVDTPTRMTSLGNQMVLLFGEALKKNSAIELVQHLEATTAAEESLLLYMGLSKLPGGRTFSPQSDVTMEFRVTETDAIGKTFEETGIELGLRWQPAGKPPSKWITVSGKVGGYDALASQAWQHLEKERSATPAKPSQAVFDNLATRRKQAKLEMQAARSLQPSDDMTKAQLLTAKIRHLDIAMKLDPQFRAASKLRLQSWHGYLGYHYAQWEGSRNSYAQIYRVEQHDERFSARLQRDHWMQSYAWLAVRMSPLMSLYMNQPTGLEARKDRPAIESLRRMIDRSVRGSVRNLTSGTPRFLPVVYRGMVQFEPDTATRRKWLESVVRSVQEQIGQLKTIRRNDQPNLTFRAYWICLLAAELFTQDSQPERGIEVLAYIQKRLEDPKGPRLDASQYPDMYGIMSRVANLQQDPTEKKRIQRWVNAQTPIETLNFVTSDRYSSPARLRWFSGEYVSYKPTKINIVSKQGYAIRLIPMGVVGKYIYLRKPHSHEKTIGQMFRIEIDHSGRLVGKSVPTGAVGSRKATHRWDPVEELPCPPISHAHSITVLATTSKYLLVGTHKRGLWVFDPIEKTWTSITPHDGLPHEYIRTLMPVSATDVISYAEYSTERKSAKYRYRIHIPSKEITVLQKSVYQWNAQGKGSHTGTPFRSPIGALWNTGNAWWGYDFHQGLLKDALSPKPKLRKAPGLPAKGWSVQYDRGNRIPPVWVGERLYITPHGGGGVLGVNKTGKVEDTICTGSTALLPGYKHQWYVTDVKQPGSIPAYDTVTSPGNRYLWFMGSPGTIIYDTKKQLFYGPVTVRVDKEVAVGTEAGFYESSPWGGIFFKDRKQLIEVAKKAGRYGTSKAYETFRDEAIAKLPPVYRARFLLGLRRFEEAQAVLGDHLKKKPDDPLAILLQGMLLDVQDTTAVAPARTWYQKLVAMDDPRAKFTGLYMQLPMLVREKQWSQAAGVLKRIREQFPRIEESFSREIDGLEKKIKRNLKSEISP
jgi:hypothetical protein